MNARWLSAFSVKFAQHRRILMREVARKGPHAFWGEDSVRQCCTIGQQVTHISARPGQGAELFCPLFDVCQFKLTLLV